ncbi:MAG: aldo/keto reductase [Bacteroidales bacterium]|nr:aldo/keto reductase [Bacteroidales bacterium]
MHIKYISEDRMILTSKMPLGRTGLLVPQVVYGTSYLGNLYKALSYNEKLALIAKWFECTDKPVVIDSAGKYGAGLALEVIGLGLTELGISPDDILISNKLGWFRVPLTTDEPTFEPGAWADLAYDCIQTFGYDEIIKCFDQGNQLLGGTYRSEVVSIHDPDEYLLAASDPSDRELRIKEILESYRALFDLKREGRVKAVGIGSKDWTVIKELYAHVPFDWVMFANSFTIFRHPPGILQFMARLENDGVGIINSAVFHGGFLTGGDKFDYQEVDAASEMGQKLIVWREAFEALCQEHLVSPGDGALHFGLSHPAVVSIALNTSKPEKMMRNVETLQKKIPESFWKAMKEKGLMDPDYRYL